MFACQVRRSTNVRSMSVLSLLQAAAVIGILSLSSLSSFVHASTNSSATNSTSNNTSTSTTGTSGLCVNVTTPTNVTSTVTNSTDNTTSTVTALQDVVTCVACENVTAEKNVTTTSVNATDNSTISTTALANVTECVPTPAKKESSSTEVTVSAAPTVDTTDHTKILGSLELSFTVPAGTTAAALNSNANFKAGLAKSIKKALALGDTAIVSIKEIKDAASATAAANSLRRSLSSALLVSRKLTTTSLKLDISYEISLPKADASAIYAKIADKATFGAAVKSNSVAELAAAGITGHTVDAVVVAAASGDLAPVVDDEEKDSGAFSTSTSLSRVAILVVGSLFSLRLVSA